MPVIDTVVLDRASVEFVFLSKPHEYRRWRDHITTYSEFKKEMWDNYPTTNLISIRWRVQRWVKELAR